MSYFFWGIEAVFVVAQFHNLFTDGPGSKMALYTACALICATLAMVTG